jgi:hypothetical protein
MSLHSPVGLSSAEDADEPTCTLYYIRRRLGRPDFKEGRMVKYVGLLIAEKGFPPPLPDMVGKRLVEHVTVRSRWLRHAVDAWLEDTLPPDNAGQVDKVALQAAAADMDAAAFNLGGGLRVIAGGRP